MIIEDTRQQAGKHEHIAAWMSEHGVEFAPRARALPFGDYMRDGSNICIDTKKDVLEVAGNVGKDHARFVRELERAANEGYRLVILVEERPSYNERKNLYKWRNPHGRIQGPTLAKMITTLEKKYGVRFEFCHRRDTAKRICEILGVTYGDGKGKGGC